MGQSQQIAVLRLLFQRKISAVCLMISITGRNCQKIDKIIIIINFFTRKMELRNKARAVILTAEFFEY